MLMVSSYAKDYVDACRAKVAAQLARYRKVRAAKPVEIDTFERQLFNHMILALDHYFVHRGRTMEGKDGNPLNEGRMLCDAIMENDGRMSASKTIRYKPESSILKFKAGDEIRERRRLRPAVRGVLRRDRGEISVTGLRGWTP